MEFVEYCLHHKEFRCINPDCIQFNEIYDIAYCQYEDCFIDEEECHSVDDFKYCCEHMWKDDVSEEEKGYCCLCIRKLQKEKQQTKLTDFVLMQGAKYFVGN